MYIILRKNGWGGYSAPFLLLKYFAIDNLFAPPNNVIFIFSYSFMLFDMPKVVSTLRTKIKFR